MSAGEDFASLMEGAGQGRAMRPVRRGETVEGTVVAVGHDTLFLDIGAAEDARVERGECVDDSGRLTVRVGDTLRGVVVETGGPEGPRISVTVGRGQVDLGAIRSAQEAGIPVEGVVKAANKGGLEVQLGAVRAFCPASQVELGRSEGLEAYVGRSLKLKVLEVRDDGSVVVSRRKQLEEERAAEGQRRLEALKVGAEVEGTVTALQRYGAFVDIGGVEGLVHISELSSRRVDRVEDVLSVGDTVRVRVVAVEPSERGARVSLSMKALDDAEHAAGYAAHRAQQQRREQKIGTFGALLAEKLGLPRPDEAPAAVPAAAVPAAAAPAPPPVRPSASPPRAEPRPPPVPPGRPRRDNPPGVHRRKKG